MTTIAHAESFLEDSSYENFMNQTDQSFREFLDEITEHDENLYAYASRLLKIFKSWNFENLLLTLEQNKHRLRGVNSYYSMIKEIKRLIEAKKIHDAVNEPKPIKSDLIEVLNKVRNDKNEAVIAYTLQRIEKNSDLKDRRMLLKGNERTIFSTKVELNSILSLEEEHEEYKRIIERLREIEMWLSQIKRI